METETSPSMPLLEPKYAEHTRFEIELEFVQCLSNPLYLQQIAQRKFFEQPEFIAYLSYLQYFKEPKYARYLFYPGPTLRVLELIQQKDFRERLIDMDFMYWVINEFMKASTEDRPK